MSKKWEVNITVRTMVYVDGADTQDQAIQYAKDEMNGMDGDVECVAKELTNDHDADVCRRHADLKSEAS